MISTAQAKQYLDQALSIGLPDFLIAAAVARVETAEAAMITAGYSDEKQVLIQSMAVAIVAAAGDPRRLTAQGAASGASRGFKTREGDLSALRRALLGLDTAGTVAEIVGPDPAAQTMFFATCG
jgi:hypothetical protein